MTDRSAYPIIPWPRSVEARPGAFTPRSPIEDTYAYEPIPAELTTDEVKHVIGTQGCMWTEYMPTPEQVEPAYPRALALAEKSFQARMPAALALLDRLGVNYRRPG